MTSLTISIFLGALISIATITLTVLLGVWTYRDAQNKGLNGILWTAVVVLVPSYIGLIIYLIVRMDNNKVICSDCNTAVNGKNKFCSNCGVNLVPIVDVSEEVEEFKRSQRKVLIGFFSTLAGIVILSIFMIACVITGALRVAGDTVKWVSKIDGVTLEKKLEEALGNVDVLFDEDEIHINGNRDEITFYDKDDNVLIYMDGSEGIIDVNLKGIRALLEKYNIDYNEEMSEEELEKAIEKEMKKAVQDAMDE